MPRGPRTCAAVLSVTAGLLLATAPAAHAVAPASPSPAAAPQQARGHCGYYDGQATTRRGDSGDGVREVQCLINYWSGRSVLDGDGDFGPQTESWVAHFQDVHGLLADGVVGPQTWKALRAA
ncbi:peptidoglycan-binding protein [Streptomyces sp. NPDC058989]|uniref:peptidoglycan-binding domain-containing protein n=1 Tax=Streptomyces sp. NPDC058989 TaxID=3346686 RepID=UPI003699BC83